MSYFAKNLFLVIISIVLGIFTNIGLSFFSNQVVAPLCVQLKLHSLNCGLGLDYKVLLYTFVAIFLLWFLLLRLLFINQFKEKVFK
jgi:hypothetical protein